VISPSDKCLVEAFAIYMVPLHFVATTMSHAERRVGNVSMGCKKLR
jgi:hypothetical protein